MHVGMDDLRLALATVVFRGSCGLVFPLSLGSPRLQPTYWNLSSESVSIIHNMK
jgi:hypothetical protein